MTPESTHRSASPHESPSGRRAPKLAIGLGAVALLAAVALISRGSDEASGTSDARKAAGPGSHPTGSGGSTGGGGPTGQGGSEKSQEKPPRFAGTTCWQQLDRFNDTVTLATFREWSAPLLSAKDPLVLQYLKERLSELIGNDEGRASEVLGWAREAPPAEFKLLLAGLRGSQAIGQPKVAAQLTSFGLDESIDLGRRAGFLDELQHLKQLEPAVLERLTHFAKDPASGEAGWVTTRAIGQVMKEDYARTGNAKPYLDKLLTIGVESQEEPVRYLALEMGLHAGAPLDTQSTERLAKILATEGSGEVRQVAAHDLSLAQDKAQALELYAKAFTAEQDLCVRWALFRFAARAAGKDALPVMANMAMTDPRFQGDYHDFERLYASGIVDFDRIWFSLPSQDPHGCLDHHDG
jgi:hypothetical protein